MGALTNAQPFALTNYNMTTFQMCSVSAQMDAVKSFMDKNAELQMKLKNLPLPRLHDTPKQSPQNRRKVQPGVYYVRIPLSMVYAAIAGLATTILLGSCITAAL
jgi:hypothetical protein